MKRNIFAFALFITILCVPQLVTAQSYVSAADAFREEGMASWYGAEFDGRPTASGEIFNSSLFTAAHPSLPFGTFLVVTNKYNNRQVTVKVNDRGPFVASRIIDLSKAAAEHIDMVYSGTAPVMITTMPGTYLQPPVVQLPSPAPVIQQQPIIQQQSPQPTVIYAPEPPAPIAAPPAPTVPVVGTPGFPYPPITLNVYTPPPASPQQPPAPVYEPYAAPPAPVYVEPYAAAPAPVYVEPYAAAPPAPIYVEPYAAPPPPPVYLEPQYLPPAPLSPPPQPLYAEPQYLPPAPLPPSIYAEPQYLPPAPLPPVLTPPSALDPLPPIPAPTYVEAPLPSPLALPPSGVKLTPSINPLPDAMYRLQVGSYKAPRNAVDAFDKLKRAGLNPSYEQNGDFYRVVLTGIRGAEIPIVTDKLEKAGFREAVIRAE